MWERVGVIRLLLTSSVKNILNLLNFFILLLCLLGESWVAVVAVIYTVIEISLSIFILENLSHHHGIDGFEIIAHISDANDVSENVKTLLAKKNERKIKVLLSSGKTSYFDESEFETEYVKNFKRCFETSAQEDPLRIPWDIPKSFKKIINTMDHWCKDTNKGYRRIKGLVLQNFSILKHAYGYGFTQEMLRDDMKIGNLSNKPIILVYNPNERAILLLRKAESEKLATDLELASNDLKLFILLFHDVLANSHMKVIPLVITEKADNLDCHQCRNHVLSEKEFVDIGTFNRWWIASGGAFGTGRGKDLDESKSKTFLAKLLGVLSVAQLYSNYMPKLTDEYDFHQHMEQLKVLLTPEQLDIYYSEKRRMIIKGGFGCGKSIIAAAMLQKISGSLKEDEKVFYICYEPRSDLLNKMVKGNQEKVVPFLNKNNLKLSKIIEHITKEERPGKINIIVDEYDGEDLDKSEAQKINHYIIESFKEAFIVLIAQPIEKGRVIKEIPQNKNRFDLLEETMGAPRYLRWNMRNSIEIHKLIEATKKVLSGVKIDFIYPEENKTGDQLNGIKDNVEENSITNGFVLEKKDTKEPEFEGERIVKGESQENIGDFPMGLEEAQAVMASSMEGKTGGNKIVSSFSYTEVHKTGHLTKTKKPVLFELDDQEEFEKHLSLLVIFEKILGVCKEQVVLHFDTMPNAFPSALRFVFDHHLLQKKITKNYKEFKSAEGSILACSYPKFRGLEHSIITVLIDRDIYHLQHYLVEMIARCTSELYIVVLQSNEALKPVTDVWNSNRLVDQCKTDTTKDFSERTSLLIQDDEYPEIIRGIFSSEKYEKLEKAFKDSSTSEDEVIAAAMERMAMEVIDKKRYIAFFLKRNAQTGIFFLIRLFIFMF